MKKNYYAVIMILSLAAIAISGCATHAPYFRLDSSLQRDIRSLNGIEYLPLERLCSVYQIDYKWDAMTGVATLQKKSNFIVLRSGSDRILVNGDDKRLDAPVVLSGGAVLVPVSFVRSDIRPLAGTVPAKAIAPQVFVPGKFTFRTIILDPGHGGRDVGAIGRRLGLREKDMALAVAKRIKNILEDEGIKIIMTRNDDTFIPLSRRVEIANRANADLFVSVHINASRARYMRGFECYYLADTTDDNARARQAFEKSSLRADSDASIEHSRQLDKTLWDMTLTENRLESSELAGKICDSVEQSLAMGNKGVRSARFYVLKFTTMPSVLVEAGYISNRYEESKLQDPKFLDRIADAVSQGILKYKREYERTEGFTRV